MHSTKNEHVFRVMMALEHVFQVCRDEILTGGRPDEIAFARQVGMFALMDFYGY
jgi:chromosomal replication initiation ATPase DnaA